MVSPPGSTEYVRFDDVPLVTILRGPDAAAGFNSAALSAPGSTGFVAFDTVPLLWFEFPPLQRQSGVSTTARPSEGLTTPTKKKTSLAKPGTNGPDQRTSAKRPAATQRPTLAATGGPETSVTAGLGLLLAAWLIRRGREPHSTGP